MRRGLYRLNIIVLSCRLNALNWITACTVVSGIVFLVVSLAGKLYGTRGPANHLSPKVLCVFDTKHWWRCGAGSCAELYAVHDWSLMHFCIHVFVSCYMPSSSNETANVSNESRYCQILITKIAVFLYLYCIELQLKGCKMYISLASQRWVGCVYLYVLCRYFLVCFDVIVTWLHWIKRTYTLYSQLMRLTCKVSKVK